VSANIFAHGPTRCLAVIFASKPDVEERSGNARGGVTIDKPPVAGRQKDNREQPLERNVKHAHLLVAIGAARGDGARQQHSLGEGWRLFAAAATAAAAAVAAAAAAEGTQRTRKARAAGAQPRVAASRASSVSDQSIDGP